MAGAYARRPWRHGATRRSIMRRAAPRAMGACVRSRVSTTARSSAMRSPMAIALRNSERLAEGMRTRHARRAGGQAAGAPLLVTGTPGWLGSRLVEALVHGLADDPRFAVPEPGQRVRCLVQEGADPAPLLA